MGEIKTWALLVISEDNTMDIVGFDDYHVELEDLYRLTDCRCIQIVNSQEFDNVLICIDDNGKLDKKDVNLLATCLYAPQYDFIVGKAVIGTSMTPNQYDEPDLFAMPYGMACQIKYILEDFLREREKQYKKR